MMNFKIGDKVKVLDEASEGVISKILTNTAIVEVDGFDFEYSIYNLLKVDEESKRIDFVLKEHKFNDSSGSQFNEAINDARNFRRIEKESEKRNSKGILEVDLHVQSMEIEHHKMTNYEIISHQVEEAVMWLEYALKKNEKRIVFIHGVGEGVLKNELRKQLKSYSNITIEDGSFKLYGYGATEVFIK